jgi:hypothetical protein
VEHDANPLQEGMAIFVRYRRGSNDSAWSFTILLSIEVHTNLRCTLFLKSNGYVLFIVVLLPFKRSITSDSIFLRLALGVPESFAQSCCAPDPL